MDLCIFVWFGYKYSFSEMIKLIKEAGFQSVMTYWGDEYNDTCSPKELEPGIVRNSGLNLENTHFSFTGINNIWKDSLDGQDIFNMYYSYIDNCKTYEIPTAVMHVSSGENPPPYNRLGLDRFRRLVEKAEKDCVNIALENTRNPEYLDYIYSNINSDRLKFCYDSGHENCYTKGANFLAKYGDKLGALHLHDNNGKSDQHLLPFDGNIDWKQKILQIKNIGYKGALAFEAGFDGSKEYSASEFLSELIKRAHGLLEII